MSNGCGFGSMAKVGQESDKEQKGGTRSPRGLCTDKTRLMDGRGPGRGDSRSSRAAGGGHIGGTLRRTGSATAAIFHSADVRFRCTITTKHKQKWRTPGRRRERGNEAGKRPEIRSERGKWGKTEIKRRETEGGRETEKGRSPRDGTTSIGVSLLFLFRRTPPFHPCCSCTLSLQRVGYHVDHGVSSRSRSAGWKLLPCAQARSKLHDA